MLIQLRRVVYLLVFLQCSLSVCLANEGKPTETDEAYISLGDALKESIHRADKLIVKRTVCMEKGVKSLNDYVEKFGDAKNAKRVAEEGLKDVQSFVGYTAVEAGAQEIKHKLPDLKGRLGEADAVLMATHEAVKEAMTSLAWAEYVRGKCGNLSGSMGEEMGRLRKNVDDLRGLFDGVAEKTDEMKRLEEECNKIIETLYEQKEEVKKYESNVTTILTDGQDLLEIGKALASWNATFSEITSEVTELESNSAHQVTGKLLETKLREAFDRAEGKWEVAKESFVTEMEAVRIAAEKESEKSFESAIEAEAQRLAAEKRKEEEAEKERKVQEEKERLAREAAEREAKEKENAQKEEEENKKAEEEAEKKEAEEKEKQKEKEKKAREELEKLGMNKDGSSNPALLQSPLLLLLLCVLGSILVC